MRPSAPTDMRSVTKQATKIVLPYSVVLKPNSSVTVYTMAAEVVDMAIPASQLGITSHPRT